MPTSSKQERPQDLSPQALERYYGDLATTFLTEGWKHTLEAAQAQIDALGDVRMVKDQRDLDFKQGALYVLDWLMTWEAVCRKASEEVNAPDV